MATKQQWKTVFRAKRVSADKPRLGTPESVQPGDVLDFYAGGCYSREVDTCHKGYVTTKPLVSPYGTLDGPRKVMFADMASAVRPIDPVAEPVPTPAPPAPPAKKVKQRKPKAPAPEVKAVAPAAAKPKRQRKKKQPPAHLLDFLDSSYGDD